MGRRRAAPAPASRSNNNASASTKSLKAVLEEGSLDSCLCAIADAGRHSYAEQLKVLGRKVLLDLCTAVLGLVEPAIQLINEPPEDEDEQELVARLDHALKVLRGSAMLLTDVLSECRSDPPEQLTQTATLLHDHCLLVMEDIPELQDAVSRLCCHWLELQAPHYECMAAQALPHLLAKTLDAGRAMDIKLCYTLREGFTLFDYDDESSADTKRLMLRAAMHPAFLARPDGRKFISFVFRLHAPLVQELNAVVKNQIPSSRKSLLDGYGEIIMRAWRDSVGGPLQFDIEAYCVQDLMRAAIHASSAPLGAALRQVLGALHSQKKMAGVEAMLCRLYEPILFRAFGATNSDMRRNALLLLLDAFPIRDPDAPPEETDESMTRQFRLLQQSLSDDCPVIREMAARGVLALINNFWELIPSAAIAVFITKLTNEIAYDSSWPGVRVAVLEGMVALVDNPHAQPVLRKALPQLAMLLGDPVLKVREAMASLLVAVSRSRSLHFYEVVPLDALLSVMAVDAPSVSAPVQAILLPSYFPTPEEGALHVVNLLKAKPQAGQAFCSHLVAALTAAVDTGCADEEEDEEEKQERVKRATAVPVEHILCLVRDLMGHMLATCTNIQQQPTSPAGANKKARSKAGSKARGKKATTGKRRKGAAQGAAGDAPPGADADDAEDDGGADAAEQPVDDDEPETPDTWASWAAGLAVLCRGLACGVQLEQCGAGDLEEVFDSDLLVLLYEASPNDAARCGILTVATDLSFLPAATALRNMLLSQLSPAVPLITMTNSNTAVAAVAGTGRAGADPAGQVDVLRTALRCLCTPTSGERLISMMSKALKLRDAATVYVPVGATPPVNPDDGICCGACGLTEPEDYLLLCDGCDSAYHMACVRPAMTIIPPGEWFCHTCETELQRSAMTPTTAIRCMESLLSWPEGRQLLHSRRHLLKLMVGLQEQAGNQCQRLVRDLGVGMAGAVQVTEVVEEMEEVEEVARPAKQGKKRGGRKGKNAAGAVATEQDQPDAGSLVDSRSWGEMSSNMLAAATTVNVYCKAALHLALAAMLLPPPEDDDDDDEDQGEEAEGGSGGGAGSAEDRRAAKAQAAQQQALITSAAALTEVQEMCEQMLESVTEVSSCPLSKVYSAVMLSKDVLSVLSDAQILCILDISHSGDTAQVQHVCAMGVRVLEMCSHLLSSKHLEGCPADVVHVARGAVSPVLQLCTQLVKGVGLRRGTGQGHAGDPAATGAVESLEGRLEDADPRPHASPEALSALDSLSCALLDMTLDTDTGVATTLAALLKPQMASLVNTLMDPTCTVPKTWLSRILSATGAGAMEEPVPALPGLQANNNTEPQQATDDQGAGDDEQPRDQAPQQQGAGKGKGKGKTRPILSGPSRVRKRGGKALAAAAEAAQDADGAAQDQGDGARPEGEEAGREDVEVVGSSEAGVVAGMLLAACKAQGQQEAVLDQLARVAVDSWQSAAGLGALALMQRLGISGLKGRRLRLTGSEANLLIKLDMLESELAQAIATARGSRGGDATDVAEQHQAQLTAEQAARALHLVHVLVG